MRILIVHYHLDLGGVTRIIESQVRALREYVPDLAVTIITGHCETADVFRAMGAEIIINEDLYYLADGQVDYKAIFNRLVQFFTKVIRKDDILHVHNLSLGKNPLLTMVISEMAGNGITVINHVHDFAEDRPENMNFLRHIVEVEFQRKLKDVLYPDCRNCGYILLTSFDLNRLISCGINKSLLFLLPNPVVYTEPVKEENRRQIRTRVCEALNLDENKMNVTYPVRVIRRKNIGEFILLASFFMDQSNWIVTQPPRNAAEVEPYVSWKNFCLLNSIPVQFDAATMVPFEDLMMATDLCISTSIREGFGMVFIEPWLMNIPVVGRDIPQVTADIESEGIQFPLLYKSILIAHNNQQVDFAELSVADQMLFIEYNQQHKLIQKQVLSQNPFLENLLTSFDENIVKRNKSIILENFSLKKYARRLERIYQKVTR